MPHVYTLPCTPGHKHTCTRARHPHTDPHVHTDMCTCTDKAYTCVHMCTPYRHGPCMCASQVHVQRQRHAQTRMCTCSMPAEYITQRNPEITPVCPAPCQPCGVVATLQPPLPSLSTSSTQQAPAGQKIALWKQSGPNRLAIDLSARI